MVLLSLDYLYTPSADVDAAVARCVEDLGGVLLWRIAAAGTIVAALRQAQEGPLLLFADHLEGNSPIAIFRVGAYAGSDGEVARAGVSVAITVVDAADGDTRGLGQEQDARSLGGRGD